MTTKNTVNSYNKHAKDYNEYVNRDSNFWNRYLEVPAMKKALKGKVSGKYVLDLGCGSGVSTGHLIDLGAEVVGIDISEKMIDVAKQNYPNNEFFVESMEKLHFEDNTFDVVSSSLALHYNQKLYPTFKEVGRVLKPKGRFVFSTSHPLFDVRRKVLIEGKKEYVLENYFQNDKKKWTMFDKEMEVETYHHTFSDLTNNLIDAGFLICEVVETRPIPEGKKVSPSDYEHTMKIPSFIIFESIKADF